MRPSDDTDLAQVLRTVAGIARPRAADGELADYIAPLADADPEAFGLAVVEMDGTEHVVGDVDVPFPIQSIAKVFALVLSMQKADVGRGVEAELWRRVGREPSGDPFNSLVQLEYEAGVPRNPMINAGALVVTDVLIGHGEDPSASMHTLLSELAGGPIGVDESVLSAERRTGARNEAMAHLMASFGNLTHPVQEVLDTYVEHCAITMTTRQLARATRCLANDGIDPATRRRILSGPLARRVAAVMLTCGTYDSAGEFAFSVGLPCKSGVAGGIIAAAPEQAGIAVWSPPLDATGNSLAGRIALHELTDRLHLSVF